MSGNSGRLLRSNCRSHGSGCSCPVQELPSTPRRSRSMSKTPSRASSVAPELTFHPLETSTSPLNINGSVASSLYSSNNHSSESLYRTGSHFEETSIQQIRRNYINEEISARSRYEDDNRSSRSLRFDEDDRLSHVKLRLNGLGSERGSSPGSLRDYNTRSGQERSRGVQRMVKVFSIEEEEAEEIDNNTNLCDDNDSSSTLQVDELNGSMAFSLNSSFSSTIGHETSRVSTSSTKVTTTKTATKTIQNGHHVSEENRRLISILRSSDADSSGIYGGYNNNFVSRIKESCRNYDFSSRTTSVVTYIQNTLLYVPRLIYWSLVNMFVCEKWLLHQSVTSSSSNSSLLKRLLLLGLLLLLSGFLYGSSGLIATLFDRSVKVPVVPSFPESGPPPSLPPSLPPEVLPVIPKCCEVPQPIIEIDKLLERLTKLEKSQQQYQQLTQENYSQQLKLISENLKIKLQEEIQKIEPTKVIVEKQTVIERVTDPPPEPEPLDLDKLSNSLLPLILPLVMDKVKGQVDILKSEIECPDKNVVETSGSILPAYISGGLDLDAIEKLIRAAISKYDADKTGLPDLALEPAGGSILSTRCTKSSQSKNSVLTLWGWRVWSFSNSPRSIIQPGVVPGECWVVEGATAEVVIQLISPAVITGFTLEHIPKSISPYGKIDTAPRKFQVMGLMSENDLDTLWDYGSFEYLDNNEPIQYFAVQNKSEIAYPIVELRVLSNHGSVKSTCIYRFRVHGGRIDFKH
ncbi:unnamed protein product [Allacma fusca]|uniref:SUN domain-containing protein n=1 Tax=Allacma fusca TaxID=39272 RepID=A0A8J2PKL0_9HEXA|nr:unnamed protein product [Allacma fusca]